MISPNLTRQIVASLGLDSHYYAICGGALMAEHGLRNNENDIDLLATTELCGGLAVYGWQMVKKGSTGDQRCATKIVSGIKIEAFPSVTFGKDFVKVREYIDRQETRDGLPFVRLEDMLEWKQRIVGERTDEGVGRHRRDVMLLKEALGIVTVKLSWDFSWK